MLLMESYLCYCSVRLGVISIVVLSMLRTIAFSIIFFVSGLEILEPFEKLFEKDADYKINPVVRKFLSWYKNNPENVLIFFQARNLYNILSSCLCIYGALKLRKWFLLPFTFAEFFFFIEISTAHILLMIMLKKIINLGVLITITLAGSFVVLYIGYNCVTCVAFFQIINLVNTERYKALYGNDPFHPIKSMSHDFKQHHEQLHHQRGGVENIHVLTTPDEHDIDDQKRLAKLGGLWSKQNQHQLHRPTIIGVIPVSHFIQSLSPKNPIRKKTIKWWQQRSVAAAGVNVSDKHLTDSALYRNWQPAELVSDTHVMHRHLMHK